MKFNYICVRYSTPLNRHLVITDKDGYTNLSIPFIGSYWSGLSELIDARVVEEAENYELEETTENDDWNLPFDYEELCRQIAEYTCVTLLGCTEDEWEFLGVDMPEVYNYGDDNLWVRISNKKLEEIKSKFDGDYFDDDFRNSPITKALIQALIDDGLNKSDLDYIIGMNGDRGLGAKIFYNMYNNSDWFLIKLIHLDKLQEDISE